MGSIRLDRVHKSFGDTTVIRDVSLDIGIQLLIAGEQFMLDRLKAVCEDYIRKDINEDTVIGILVASHRHNASGLKDIALEFILEGIACCSTARVVLPPPVSDEEAEEDGAGPTDTRPQVIGLP